MRFFIIFIFITFSLFASDFEKSINIVTNQKHNIMWQDNLESTQYIEDITMAKTYCENLILNGYIDWEMATIKQLLSIIDISSQKIAIKKEFQYSTATKYWSSTPYVANKNQYWYVDFKTGLVNHENQNKKYTVRCIRNLK